MLCARGCAGGSVCDHAPGVRHAGAQAGAVGVAEHALEAEDPRSEGEEPASGARWSLIEGQFGRRVSPQKLCDLITNVHI